MRSSGLGEGGGRGGRPNPNPHWLDADMQCCTPTREAGKGSASVRRLSLIYSAVGVWKRQSAVSPKASRSGTRYSSGAALGARKDPSVVDGVGLPRAGELATAPPLQIGHLAQRLPPASGKWLGVPGLNFSMPKEVVLRLLRRASHRVAQTTHAVTCAGPPSPSSACADHAVGVYPPAGGNPGA